MADAELERQLRQAIDRFRRNPRDRCDRAFDAHRALPWLTVLDSTQGEGALQACGPSYRTARYLFISQSVSWPRYSSHFFRFSPTSTAHMGEPRSVRMDRDCE